MDVVGQVLAYLDILAGVALEPEPLLLAPAPVDIRLLFELPLEFGNLGAKRFTVGLYRRLGGSGDGAAGPGPPAYHTTGRGGLVGLQVRRCLTPRAAKKMGIGL